MREIRLSADELVASLLFSRTSEPVCILDSCGVGHLGSHLLIAGVRPIETIAISDADPERTLALLDQHLSENNAAIFTIAYDFGLKLQNIEPRPKRIASPREPDVYLAMFDSLVVHEYRAGKTSIYGNNARFAETEEYLLKRHSQPARGSGKPEVFSNFSRSEYLQAVDAIKECIRRGDTYQANLTQQFRAVLPESETGENVFWRLRRDHPAPFAAFIRRRESTVISASPERFFKISAGGGADMDAADRGLDIAAAPVKGTQRRGTTPKEDAALREELLRSEKERAENMMIVDLLRNDLGRVSEYGSVIVDKLCSIEEHPTLFHLVSTVRGRLRRQTRFSKVLRAVFPCGSITGAPKLSTMKILEEFETANRGLSMGAIGCYLPPAFGISDTIFDLNVAIRTMVVQGGEAIFNVGGGITIDSVPDKEYEESLLKAEALLKAIGA